MIKVETSRFGIVEFRKEDLLFFPEGIIGFDQLRHFFFLNDPFDEIFIWLQSFEKPNIAFPVLEPVLFDPNYKVELSKSDLEILSLKRNESYQCFSIVTIPEDPNQMTANLKAPIVLNTKFKRGKQCVLQDPNLSISALIFSKLKHQLVENSSFSFKPRTGENLSQKSPVLSIHSLSSFYKKVKEGRELSSHQSTFVKKSSFENNEKTFPSKGEKERVRSPTEVEI